MSPAAAATQAKSQATEKPPEKTDPHDASLPKTAPKNDRPINAGQGEEARWWPVLGLPCQLTVDLPLPEFRVADFLRLRSGSVIATGWRLTRDVPLRVNGILIGWGEFEGAGKRMGIRLTELA